MTVLQMCCKTGLSILGDNSVDAIVTDPPYELTSARPGGRSAATQGKVMKGFMGMEWDGSGIAFDAALWAEAMRVLKPGGHLLAFGGSRTYHRMACAIEDGGFEIRDQIMWLYGSGFPKSHNGPWGGTALKPAHEPICVARKPLVGTVAANVLAHGTGALNIDGCRVGTESTRRNSNAGTNGAGWGMGSAAHINGSDSGRWPANVIHDGSDEVRGAFPSAAGQQGGLTGNEPSARPGAADQNCYGLMDRRHTSEPRREEDKSAARFFYCAKASKKDREEGLETFAARQASIGDERPSGSSWERRAPEKNPNAPRANIHPTVKPTDLMRYLVRLVTPPGGLVVDLFAGSGSTGKAAKLEGFQFLGFELSEEYAAIANARIEAA